jgi:hypothetical protein
MYFHWHIFCLFKLKTLNIMKAIKAILIFFTVSVFSNLLPAQAQQKSREEVRQLVESQNFVFKAETANPVRGGSRQLSSGYDLTVSKNSVIAYLPFFGRAQTIPIGTEEGGIKFTSSSFDYSPVSNKSSWQITIKTNDVTHVQQLFLTIYDNGTATLDVMNLHRDNISFRGYIQ